MTSPRTISFAAAAIAFLFLAPLAPYAPALWTSREPEQISVEAFFSPGDGLETKIVEEIERAEKLVRVQMYIFTSKPVADALVAAKKRGVEVAMILDKSQEKMAYGRWPVLKRGGVKVLFDRDHEVANSKIILIDDSTVITGSYNLTKAAESKNAENIVVIKNHAEVVSRFSANFEHHRAHARPPSK